MNSILTDTAAKLARSVETEDLKARQELAVCHVIELLDNTTPYQPCVTCRSSEIVYRVELVIWEWCKFAHGILGAGAKEGWRQPITLAADKAWSALNHFIAALCLVKRATGARDMFVLNPHLVSHALKSACGVAEIVANLERYVRHERPMRRLLDQLADTLDPNHMKYMLDHCPALAHFKENNKWAATLQLFRPQSPQSDLGTDDDDTDTDVGEDMIDCCQ